jgi:hypothetical protein
MRRPRSDRNMLFVQFSRHSTNVQVRSTSIQCGNGFIVRPLDRKKSANAFKVVSET